MNTVDALKDLYKTLCGKDYAGDPNPTDAEMISAIAKDASSSSGSGSNPITIHVFVPMTDDSPVYEPIAPGLTMDDLMGARIELESSDRTGEISGLDQIRYVVIPNNDETLLKCFGFTPMSNIYYNPATGAITESTE